METRDKIQQAIALFDQQKYGQAFAAFVKIYDSAPEERKNIFHMLKEAYYTPNEEELRANYTHNAALLKQYPYVWEKIFHDYQDVSIQIFPVDEGQYYIFDKKQEHFEGPYIPESSEKMRYFFQDLSKPIQIKNEENFYNLKFLNDNVRSSEDYANDNHIYLLYTSFKPLECLMITCNLKLLLEQQKFIFLIGEKNWSRYPINFRKKFGLHYANMKPTPIRIDEVKRICFWYKHAYSGTELSLGVLGSVSGIQMYGGLDFHTDSKIDGELLYFMPAFREALSQVDRTYTVEQILSLFQKKNCDIKLEGLSDYLDWLRQKRPAPHMYTVKELFCGYFLFQYEKRGLNPRIVPLMLLDPHMWDTSVYNNMVLSFPYHTVLTSMREPVVTFGRAYLYGLVGWNEFQTKYLLASDYIHTKFLPPQLLSCYFGFRFEDLKTKPETMCRALCRHLNVPFEPQMLETEAPLADRSGNVTKGFDQAPLHRDISSVLTEFDQLRLKMFYDPILKYYGYPSFSFEEYPIPEKVVRELFRYPFRFERINRTYLKDTAPPDETLHEWIQYTLQEAWHKQITVPELIPLEEPKNE